MNIEVFGWLSLPRETKEKLAGVFHIPRRGTVHVSDGKVVEDGYMKDDLVNCLTLKAMQEYTQSTSENFMELLYLAINKVEKVVPEGELANVGTTTDNVPAVPRKRGRPPVRKLPEAAQ